LRSTTCRVAVAFDPLAWQARRRPRVAHRLVRRLRQQPRPHGQEREHARLARPLWLIDHGAALYFHHASSDFVARATSEFAAIKDHVLLPFASRIGDVDTAMAPR
jgi:hypothetical protein